MKLKTLGVLMLTSLTLAACVKTNAQKSVQQTESISETTTNSEVKLSAEEFDRRIESKITQEDRDAVIGVNHYVRIKGSESWEKSVDAKVGDTLEFSIYYTNTSGVKVENVMVDVSLPDNMEYVKDSTVLVKRGMMLGAKYVENSLITDWVNIGEFEKDEEACVTYSTVVVDKSLVEGNNLLINWAKISSLGLANQGSADVYVEK